MITRVKHLFGHHLSGITLSRKSVVSASVELLHTLPLGLLEPLLLEQLCLLLIPVLLRFFDCFADVFGRFIFSLDYEVGRPVELGRGLFWPQGLIICNI